MASSQHLIIDGYNVIFQWPDLQGLMNSSPEAACERLIDRVRIIHDFEGIVTTVVFDGKGDKVMRHNPTEDITFSVLYAPSDLSADAVIEQMVNRISDPENVTVASRDNMVRETVYAIGARAITPEALDEWIQNCEKRQSGQIRVMNQKKQKYWNLGSLFNGVDME